MTNFLNHLLSVLRILTILCVSGDPNNFGHSIDMISNIGMKGILRSLVVFYVCLFSDSLRLAYDILDHSTLLLSVEYHSLSGPLAVVPVPLVPVPACRSAFFPFVEHNSLSGPLVPVPVPLAPVAACECVEQTS